MTKPTKPGHVAAREEADHAPTRALRGPWRCMDSGTIWYRPGYHHEIVRDGGQWHVMAGLRCHSSHLTFTAAEAAIEALA